MKLGDNEKGRIKINLTLHRICRAVGSKHICLNFYNYHSAQDELVTYSGHFGKANMLG